MKRKFKLRTFVAFVVFLIAATMLIGVTVAYFVPIKLRILADLGDLVSPQPTARSHSSLQAVLWFA